MEHDFFRYFIIIIFVIGALRSLFKKRPPQQQIRRPQTPEQWSVGREAAPVYKPKEEVDFEGDDAAVQREIMKMFGKEPPVVKPEVPVPPVQYSSPDTTAYAITIPAGYSGDLRKDQLSEITHVPDKKLISEEAAFRFRESITNKLRHPESLKDYIVISEILGKPKAFE
jgi:hypothetical protein